MGFLRRISLITLIILVAVSIFQDLAHSGSGISLSNKADSELPPFEAVPVKVKPGDTVLSITEEIQTASTYTAAIDIVLEAFESLNPNTSPGNIQIHEIYYFPLFQEK
ncbi:hypothetical protein [Oceanobacillus neutriphilus]|uniref:LysM domain-containing protein n=1 Tax=Oceanobacillus neutriphilus TaxID=531815 RepID=A0ABQ2NX46_9BACI|nr:hypothetical protein [Oceanobacillus neutriphilus]GGP12708.1 hypothetical protein GCM10011346_29750 [Oceanobacillus neutriphilus]